MKYIIKRSKRRKNFAIKISQSTGEIVVYAPYNATKEKIQSVVNSKREWIEKYTNITDKRLNLLPRLLEGEKIYIAGGIYTISYNDENVVFLQNDGKTLSLPRNNLKGGLKAFIKSIFLPYITQKTEYFTKKCGFKYRLVRLKSTRRVWGSCSVDNVISYSLSLALIPEDLCDYIVLHELCHTVQKNHQKAYYQLLCSVLPDYKQRQNKLKEFNAYCRFLGE
ncbi:MAG: M48 family metallopeptidase [Clostridia bacterium]|nr:M48 family metallopeptidase [Clostridia bacterium]